MNPRKQSAFDALSVRHSLSELVGIAALLLDAARYGDVSPQGVRAAARYIEAIHTDLEEALDINERQS